MPNPKLAELVLSDDEAEQSRWALPVDTYRLTGRFGATSSLWSAVHTGLDFAAPTGQPIRSITKGTVTEAGSAGPYGNRTIVRSDDGIESWYCHQNEIDMSAGDKVGAGQVIGNIGSTGNVTVPRVHLEIRPGDKDPLIPRPRCVSRDSRPGPHRHLSARAATPCTALRGSRCRSACSPAPGCSARSTPRP